MTSKQTSDDDRIDEYQQQEDELNVVLGSNIRNQIRTHHHRMVAINKLKFTISEFEKALSHKYIITNWFIAGLVGFIIGSVF